MFAEHNNTFLFVEVGRVHSTSKVLLSTPLENPPLLMFNQPSQDINNALLCILGLQFQPVSETVCTSQTPL